MESLIFKKLELKKLYPLLFWALLFFSQILNFTSLAHGSDLEDCSALLQEYVPELKKKIEEQTSFIKSPEPFELWLGAQIFPLEFRNLLHLAQTLYSQKTRYHLVVEEEGGLHLSLLHNLEKEPHILPIKVEDWGFFYIFSPSPDSVSIYLEHSTPQRDTIYLVDNPWLTGALMNWFSENIPNFTSVSSWVPPSRPSLKTKNPDVHFWVSSLEHLSKIHRLMSYRNLSESMNLARIQNSIWNLEKRMELAESSLVEMYKEIKKAWGSSLTQENIYDLTYVALLSNLSPQQVRSAMNSLEKKHGALYGSLFFLDIAIRLLSVQNMVDNPLLNLIDFHNQNPNKVFESLTEDLGDLELLKKGLQLENPILEASMILNRNLSSSVPEMNMKTVYQLFTSSLKTQVQPQITFSFFKRLPSYLNQPAHLVLDFMISALKVYPLKKGEFHMRELQEVKTSPGYTNQESLKKSFASLIDKKIEQILSVTVMALSYQKFSEREYE